MYVVEELSPSHQANTKISSFITIEFDTIMKPDKIQHNKISDDI